MYEKRYKIWWHPILINDKEINKIVGSYKFPFAKQDVKYFIVYKDNKKNRPLCIIFSEHI